MAIGNYFPNVGNTDTGSRLAAAQQQQTKASEESQVALSQSQIGAEKMKTQAQIHQIQTETRTKIDEMYRESNLNRTKSAGKIHEKYVQQIMA